MYRFLVNFIKIDLIFHVLITLNITCVQKVIEIYFNAVSVGVNKEDFEFMLVMSKFNLLQFFYLIEFSLPFKVSLVCTLFSFLGCFK